MWSTAEKDSRMQMHRVFAQNGLAQRKRQPFTQTSAFQAERFEGLLKAKEARYRPLHS
jgi:hypothetical protein